MPSQPPTAQRVARNLQGYARAAGLTRIHVRQKRHTFARLVRDAADSLTDVQDALEQQHLATNGCCGYQLHPVRVRMRGGATNVGRYGVCASYANVCPGHAILRVGSAAPALITGWAEDDDVVLQERLAAPPDTHHQPLDAMQVR